MQTDEKEAARPRAFYPDYVGSAPAPHGPPGWDQGPERRIDDARTLTRVLGWLGIGLAATYAARKVIRAEAGEEGGVR